MDRCDRDQVTNLKSISIGIGIDYNTLELTTTQELQAANGAGAHCA